MEYKVGEVFKYKKHYLIVRKGIECYNCFFSFEKYLYIKEATKHNVCYRPKCIRCSTDSRDDNTNVYYEEISKIEYLILRGGD